VLVGINAVNVMAAYQSVVHQLEHYKVFLILLIFGTNMKGEISSLRTVKLEVFKLLYGAALRCCTLLYTAVHCCTLLYTAVRCCTLLCNAVHCCAMLYTAVRSCTLL
jgi:hypothetical protein